MSGTTASMLNCGVVVNPPTSYYDMDRLGTMNSLSPGAFSQNSMDSQDSSSNMSAPSPMSVTLSPQSYQNILVLSSGAVPNVDHRFPQVYLDVVEQPVEKFRFRYKSEMMGTHGSIVGRSTDKNRKKTYPAVELRNYNGPAVVRCSLYTAHPNKSHRTPHTHRLVVRDGNDDKDDPHEVTVSPELGYTAVFQGMGIIHTAKKNISDELVKKKRFRRLEELQSRNMNITSLSTRDEITIRQEAELEAKKMNLNSVTLCFEAFIRDSGVLRPLCPPVYSCTINNMKSALTGELKICRIDKHVSSCLGNEEVFILVEKVGKKNIKVKFFELDDEDNEVWHDYGKFSELDVHHQYAIVFRTPPYRYADIDKTVDVYVQLYRPTDGDCSEPIKFAYKPSEKTGHTRKRQRTSVADDIPVAVVQGHLQNNNSPMLSQLLDSSITPPRSDHEYDTPPDLFEKVLNEEASVTAGMNSSEFKEYFRNLSLSSFGSTYAETFENDPLFKDGSFIQDVMDVSTDSGGRASVKKRGTESTEQPVVDKLSRVSIDDDKRKEQRVAAPVTGEQLARWAMARLNEAMLEKLPPSVLATKVCSIFSKKKTDGDGALHSAILHNMHDLVKQMLLVLGKGQYRHIINERNDRDETPLHLAVIQNQPQVLKTLLSIGANPNNVDKEGNTPLHLAVQTSKIECVSELLNKASYSRYNNGVDYDMVNYQGLTPLHVAARVKNLTAVKKLVDAGANVNKPDMSPHRTVLHFAVEEGCVEIARYLLEKTNVDVNAATDVGNTALHMAVVCEDKAVSSELCSLLMKHNANPSLENFMEPDNDLEVCAEVEIKEEPDSDDDYELKIAMESGDEDDSVKRHGQTSFDLASNKKDILELLQKVEQGMENSAEDILDVKEEPLEPNPLLEGVLQGVQNTLFDQLTLTKLCHVLDKSQGWVNLAELLDYSFLVASFRDTATPSKMLFNYADLHGNVSVQDIRSFLEALDEHEAVEAIDLMLARQVASSAS